MESRVQCPVCTLYLHSGITLESHLDTHPKDQVIKALCTLSTKTNSFVSRTPTPSQSERSYRSRSRTPAAEDSMRWMGSNRSSDSEKYWRRTPSRTKSTPLSNVSRNVTPEMRIGDISFENNTINHGVQYPEATYTLKSDKTQQTYIPNVQVSDFDQQYSYYSEHAEDREIKYSRSTEYNLIDSTNNVFTYDVPTMGTMPNLKHPSTGPTILHPKKNSDIVKLLSKPDLVKLLPKSNNILFKTNMSGVQYLAPGVNVVMPSTPTFVQKNVQNSMIMSGSLPAAQVFDSKSISQSLPNHYSQMIPGTFSPGTTVVTQNSQIIYREMVHNLDGKPFISNMPTVLGSHESVAQSSSLYQNVMVVDQFGNTSCMYNGPQQILHKPCHASVYPENSSVLPDPTLNKTYIETDSNKTLIIEVGPIVQPGVVTVCDASTSASLPIPLDNDDISKKEIDKPELKSETGGIIKGLKILSNIKVEVPVQHNKNMLNTVMDLTETNDQEFSDRSVTPEKILPDLEENKQTYSDDCIQPSIGSSDSVVSNAFSVIKNVGNPPSYKDLPSKSSIVGSKIETEFSDSCPVPDLICNEKPSISPCSELSEHGENSTDNPPLSPKPDSSTSSQITEDHNQKGLKKFSHKSFRNNGLRLNNIYVKKHKKILQIKNVKTSSVSNVSGKSEKEPMASSSISKVPENFSINKIHHTDRTDCKANALQTVSIEKLKDNESEFDADTEEQSMDIEPITPSCLNDPAPFSNNLNVQVKEEVNSSNEGGLSNHSRPQRNVPPVKSPRPINVIAYGNIVPSDFDDESNHRELLDLEVSSKKNQFVNMMNENYFGDNIYADYFTPDRIESFGAAKDSNFKEIQKDSTYLWGEPSQKEAEFVLPNFIHESYKIAESSGPEYSGIPNNEHNENVEMDKSERDSKVDMLSESRSEEEAPLNICADECMPPRGELSGQESNGDMESTWSGVRHLQFIMLQSGFFMIFIFF